MRSRGLCQEPLILDQRQTDCLGREIGTQVFNQFNYTVHQYQEAQWLFYWLFRLDLLTDYILNNPYIFLRLLFWRTNYWESAGAGLIHTAAISSSSSWQQEEKKMVNTFFASSFQDGLCAKPQSSRTTSKRREDELRFEARNNKKRCSMPATAENYQLFQVPGLLCIYALCLFFFPQNDCSFQAVKSIPWQTETSQFYIMYLHACCLKVYFNALFSYFRMILLQKTLEGVKREKFVRTMSSW